MRLPRVEEPQVGPLEGAGRFATGSRDELDRCPTGGVVEGDDRADIVPIGRADLSADGEVSGGVIDMGESGDELGGVEAVDLRCGALGGQGDLFPTSR
jgi:hypothetical protein